MRPRWVLQVALDVVREAASSRYLIVLFGLICVGLATLAAALDFEVVNGAVAAGRLFGGSIDKPGTIDMAQDVFRTIMGGIVQLVVWIGTLFLLVAVADIAPRLFAPGRVELLLSLPLRRTELVVGTYVGVLAIGLMAATLAIGGASAVLAVKLDTVTWAPAWGALAALVVFMTLYSVMLACATVARSPSLSAGLAILVGGTAVATSERAAVLALFKSGASRQVAEVVLAPLPRLLSLAKLATQAAAGEAIALPDLGAVVGGSVAFGFFLVAVACVVMGVKDH